MTDIKYGYTRISQILSVIPSITGRKDDTNDPIFGFPYQQIDQEILKKKCTIGTNVHAAINAWATDDFIPLSECERGYYESFVKWKDLVHLKPIESEIRLYDDSIKITGAIDMLAQLKGSTEFQLIDFKCSAQADIKWSLQACFYYHLLTINKFKINPSVLFIQLDKNGNLPKVHTYTITPQLKSLMISCINIYKFLTEK